MASSISPSEPRSPRLLLRLLGTAFLTWVLAAIYTLHWNPEIAFHAGSRKIKHRTGGGELRHRFDFPAMIFSGGSSGLFSVDATRLSEQHQLLSVNYAMGAGLGPGVLLQAAAADTHGGDTVVLAFEPFLLTEPMEPTSMGIQFSFAAGQPEWVTRPAFAVPAASWPSALLALRPGGYHCVTLLGKIVTRRPWYRYRLEDVDPNGLARTEVRLPVTSPPEFADTLPPAATNFLASVAEWGRTRGVKVIYSLPWGYCPTNEVPRVRARNVKLLREIAVYLPVLKDPSLGIHTEAADFSDSVWHLTSEGADRRTDELAALLKRGEYWTPAELAAMAERRTTDP